VHAWEHPLAGALNLVASPLKLSATPVRTDLPPPLLGQHTEEVLQELLGWGPERIAALRAREVL
jgi:crotonobetainyl-CoA:carnitine CoA-transferase CaiB-like acyl-CoA transferase